MPRPVFGNGHTIIRLKPGDIVEDCRYHPCVVIEVDQDDLGDDDDLILKSLVNGGEGNFSAQHCGIRLISQEEYDAWVASGIVDRDGLIAYWSAL